MGEIMSDHWDRVMLRKALDWARESKDPNTLDLGVTAFYKGSLWTIGLFTNLSCT